MEITSVDIPRDLVINRMTKEIYNQLCAQGGLEENELYLIDDTDGFDAEGKHVYNLPVPELSGDAVNKAYVDSLSDTYLTGHQSLSDYWTKSQTSSSLELNAKFSALSTYSEISNQLSNDGYLTQHQSLSDYWKKSETSSSGELSSEFKKVNNDISTKVWFKDGEDSGYNDLSVVKLTYAEYEELAVAGECLSNNIYIISSNYVDAYSKVISNLTMTDDTTKSEAATQHYVDEISADLTDQLTAYGKSISYDSNQKKLYLRNGSDILGDPVDCSDFIKDGMLSTAYISGSYLVLVFNTDAGKEAVSVSLSSMGKNYDNEISVLSNAISTIGNDYLVSADAWRLRQELLSPDEVKLYKGPGTKDISLSVGTGTQLSIYTVSLSDFYLSSETDQVVAAAVQNAHLYTDNQVSNSLSDYWKKTETSSASEISAGFDQLSDYYKKNETSGLAELSGAFDRKIRIGSYLSSVGYDLRAGDLSIVNIMADDYYKLVADEKVLSDVVYIVSADQLNARDQRIIDVAEPVSAQDAATKNYVDSKVSRIFKTITTSQSSSVDVTSAKIGDIVTIHDASTRITSLVYNNETYAISGSTNTTGGIIVDLLASSENSIYISEGGTLVTFTKS